jgi:Zn-dependent protease
VLGSFKIGSVFGITVRVHWMFVALVAFLVWIDKDNPLGTFLLLLVLFGVVFLHELGHSLVARHFGIRVLDITFWLLGGMARMSEIPEKPKVEALIAIAGPAVNFALAALTVPVMIAAGLIDLIDESGIAASWNTVMGRLALGFLFINLALGVFNLVPAFPMDGGRVLRAFFGVYSDWITATRRAVAVGRFFAGLMILIGLYSLFMGEGLSFLPLVGLFVWFAGSRELWAVRMRHGDFPGFAMAGPRPTVFQAESSSTASPVRDDETGARRPTSWPPPQQLNGSLSDEDIARLERYRGRLRNPAEPSE